MSDRGSYNIATMSSRDSELARLRTQAERLYPLESKLLKEWGGLKESHRVLEVGCGPGFLTPLLCKLASQGQVTSCDTSNELLEICRQQKMDHPKFGFKAVRSTSDKLPLDDKSQDFAYLRFVLQHAPERMQLLSDIQRTLDENGTVCVLDTDDGLNIQHPENQFVTDLIKDAQKLQAGRGGDRFVGRKVSGYLNELGYTDIQNRVLNFTTADLPFAILAKISLGFKSDLCGRREELEAWIKQTEPLATTGRFFLSAGVVLTIGKKGKAK